MIVPQDGYCIITVFAWGKNKVLKFVVLRGKKLCWKGSMTAEMPSRASYLMYYDIVWRVNLSKLWRKFVWALRTITTYCILSCTDHYLVFPTNFRIIFLPHTKTVILLEPYCGNNTETGLPVVPVISRGLLMGWAPWEWGLVTSCFYSCRPIKKPNKMKSKTDLKKYNKR